MWSSWRGSGRQARPRSDRHAHRSQHRGPTHPPGAVMQVAPTRALREHVYQGHGLACVRRARGPGRAVDRYAILRLADAVLLGELRWSGRERCYVLVPGPQTTWTSGVLSEVGVWLRRLNRQP